MKAVREGEIRRHARLGRGSKRSWLGSAYEKES